MASILVTGGTGFVGDYLRKALEPKSVVLLGRREPILMPNEYWSYMDMSEPVSPDKLNGGQALCHLAYSMQDGQQNIAYNRRLLSAVNSCSSIRRVILMSSVSVYGNNNLPLVEEDNLCYPVGEYAKTKLACEMVWREGLRRDCELTVMRPTEVIGVGGKGLLPLIQDALERPLIGAIKRSVLYHRRLHYVAVSNVVAAVLFCLQRTQPSAQETFIVSDDYQPENQGYAVMQDLVRKLSGRRTLPGPAMPRLLLGALGKITGRPLGSQQIFDSRRIRAAGFADALILRDEVRRLMREA